MSEKELKCVVCGNDFPPPKYNRTRSKYCSDKCRNRANNIRNKEAQAQWQRDNNDKKATEPSPDKLQCLICGLYYKKVGSHVVNRHGVTARDYRKAFGFDVKRGQLTEQGREVMREHVFSNGTVNNLKRGKKYWFKKGQKGVGIYERSPQTMERLKKQGKIIGNKYNKKVYAKKK